MAERQIGYRKSSFVLSARFPVVKWRFRSVAKSAFYNLRGGGCNLVLPSYKNLYYHNSFTYEVAHLWNKLPTYVKQSLYLGSFHKKLESIDLCSFSILMYVTS